MTCCPRPRGTGSLRRAGAWTGRCAPTADRAADRSRRRSRACPPAGPITDLTCLLCGDGPLLVGNLAADPDDALPAAAQRWLTAAGWRLDGPVCPDCRPRR
ncbi:hypothetical protein GCM10009629_57280 [Pseudonocardia alni]